MKYHLIALLLSLFIYSTSLASEVPNSIFGITLGSNVNTLKGNNIKQSGIISIKGIQHEKYAVDISAYSPTVPLTEIFVSVELKSRKIIRIAGIAQIESEFCQKEAKHLKEKVEKESPLIFDVLKHQGDSFYILETENKFMSIGCQRKHKSMLQYQIGLKSS